MQMPLQVTFRHLSHSDAIEEEVRKRAAKLEHFCEEITSCRVTVETEGKHRHRGRRYNVNVDITVPHGEMVFTHNHSDEDVYVAIRDALDAATRRLEEHVRRRRGQVKQHEPAGQVQAVPLSDEG
jgi:ribosomal subunit interface protein